MGKKDESFLPGEGLTIEQTGNTKTNPRLPTCFLHWCLKLSWQVQCSLEFVLGFQWILHCKSKKKKKNEKKQIDLQQLLVQDSRSQVGRNRKQTVKPNDV